MFLIHTYFSLRDNHAFERSKEKSYKKYYVENKEKIADKKGLIIKKEKSYADSAARSRESYMKDPEKSHTNSAARSKANNDKDVKTSRTLKRQRYIIPCSFYVYVHLICILSRYSLKPPPSTINITQQSSQNRIMHCSSSQYTQSTSATVR